MKKLLRKWRRWRAGRKLAKAVNDYNAGYADGFIAGRKHKEKYPFLKSQRISSFEYKEM